MRKLMKAAAAVLLSAALFWTAQAVLTPKFLRSSTGMLDWLYSLQTDDLDALFVGSSQMYFIVDARRLTERYGIRSLDLGSGGMNTALASYYLREALKYKHPKTVLIEVGTIFTPNDSIGEDIIVYTFAPARLSGEKERALRAVTQDEREIAELLYCPLVRFHTRWSCLEAEDLAYPFFPLLRLACRVPALREIPPLGVLADEVFENRGFVARSESTPVEPGYLTGTEEGLREIPAENIEAVGEMARICAEHGIRAIFLKTPTAVWSRTDSASVKRLMEEKGFEFWDLHDHLDELALDYGTDFFDEYHLNRCGAEKVTDYIALRLTGTDDGT